MNRGRVVAVMTALLLATMALIMAGPLADWLPWPVVAWFAVSHAFFCAVILRVRPFRGPYVTPMLKDDDGDGR
ncbi:MAG: hypothetical protein SFV21_09410 [Rhodospirillaceae bacterium]|nr:hypothetical protein [Rhodospirillaceae bacterium]